MSWLNSGKVVDPQHVPWSDDEDRMVRVFWPLHGKNWDGWHEVLPDRTMRAIQARAQRIGARRRVDRPKSAKRKKKRKGSDRFHYATPVRPEPDPNEKWVVECMKSGMTPTQIDAEMRWYPGTTVRIMSEKWAREKAEAREP